MTQVNEREKGYMESSSKKTPWDLRRYEFHTPTTPFQPNAIYMEVQNGEERGDGFSVPKEIWTGNK
jgi:hypothetical protein